MSTPRISTISRRVRLAAIAATAGVLLAPALASAKPGDFAFDGCLSSKPGLGCLDLPGAPLKDADGVAASPDGRSVYVVSRLPGTIAHFFRGGPDGQLSYDGCLNNNGSSGCSDLPGSPIDGAAGVAVSPDGKSVYVASQQADSVSHFFRAAGGQLTYDGCLDIDGRSGCVDLPGAPLALASDVVVSPDSKSVYVASPNSDSVAHFFRGDPSGQITYDGCVADTAASGCADLPGTPLDGAWSVAVSPDGKSVYAASDQADSIAHFFRGGPNGQISYDGCLSDTGASGCVDLPQTPLDGARDVAVSPDGESVYVAAHSTDAVAHFFRGGPDGQISYDGCVANTAEDGCADVPQEPLDGPQDLTVSPDGASVYVASLLTGGTVSLLTRAPGGQIAFDRCVANAALEGCVDLPESPIVNATGVAVSPDGRSVYASARESESVTHFFREPTPTGTPTPRPTGTPRPTATPQPQADRVAPVISRLSVSKRRFRVRTTFRYRLSESAAVRVSLRRVRRDRAAATAGRLSRAGKAGANRLALRGRIGKRRLRPGAYRARFLATDASGNRSRAVTVRFRVLRGR